MIHRTNVGFAEARNTGLEFAGGMYLFIDSDVFTPTDV